ncbi:hypothetical protein QO004_001666 [Rhizobium mesoamericanum]|nr:hypothetical protein [Rhizobium mesoamericanum]
MRVLPLEAVPNDVDDPTNPGQLALGIALSGTKLLKQKPFQSLIGNPIGVCSTASDTADYYRFLSPQR